MGQVGQPALATPVPPDLGAASSIPTPPLGQPPLPVASPVAPQAKGHKLLQILQSGIQGALAGRAADEQTIAATGGRRGGGVGTGFEAGFTLPWQRQGQQLGLQQQQANVEATRAQNAIVQTPQGPMPAWLARYTAPAAIRAGATEQAAQTGAQARVQAAQIGQRFKAVPGVGLFDTNSRQVVPGTANGVTITPEIAQDYQLPNEFIGKPMNVGQLASLERAQNQQTTTVSGAAGPALVNKRTAKTTPLGLGSPAMGGVVPIADPNNPGNVVYAPKSQAIGMASPQGAPTAAAKTAAKSEVPTNVGNQKVAFTTAIQHADLLKSAISALGNGDEQTLNALKNRFKAEFGVSGPVTAEAISDAYGREVTSILSKGHMTDSEIGTVGKTLNVNRQSPQQSLAVIDAYRALAQSKMNMLQNQVNAAKNPNAAKKNDPMAIRP